MFGTVCTSAKKYLSDLVELQRKIDPESIEALADLLFDIWRSGHRVFVFGNGGSAATSSHLVCDLVKSASVPRRRRLNAVSLVDNVPMLTALGRDLSYGDTFLFPLESYAHPGDLIIAISCSGDSENVLKACEWARDNNIHIAALTGFSGGQLSALADLHINIPSENYGLVEDVHASVGHMLSQGLYLRVQRHI
jgi:D-sedoheptulose 7-phosphate isomerase